MSVPQDTAPDAAQTPEGSSAPVQDDLAAWDAWMSGWEQFLAAALALPDTADAPAPQLPSDPIPFGPVPAELNDRLVRAQAVREAAIAAVSAKMATLRPGRTFTQPAPARPSRVIDL